jgi:integrase
MRPVRSGTHVTQIGNVWYYLRAVPSDVRDAFGVTKVKKSLETSNLNDAKRLEKIEDIKFEEKLAQARRHGPDGYSRDPAVRVEEMADQVMLTHLEDGVDLDEALLIVPEADRPAVDRVIDGYADEFDKKQTDLELLFADLKQVLPITDDWDNVRPGIVSVVKGYYDGLKAEHSINWALAEWKKAGNRPAQTVNDAEAYIDDFKDFTHLRALVAVRRPHLTAWRDELRVRGTPEASTYERQKARKLSSGGVNHRLEIVSAILRTGWRNAEIPEPNLKKINLPEEESNRGAWSKDDLLKALGWLTPGSGQAWVFVLNLTAPTRIGETVAARKEWYKPLGFIEVPRQYTKKKKPHVMPIIDLLRGPLEKHLEMVEDGDFMFDLPRPSNPKLKVGHEASKWFSRFHARHEIPQVIHELRDTWIETARHNETVKKDIYEIITGHSAKTGSDGYGGERPSALMAANESICKDLLDADLTAAILRLVE